jgi:hypothetical protein
VGADKHPNQALEVLVVHANALLTPGGRLELAETVVEDRWPLRRAAERFQVWVPTAQRWAARYRQRDLSVPAIEAMKDRSSRPGRSPYQTRPVKVRKIVYLRSKRGWGPARIGHKLALAPSTVNRVLRRQGVPRLNQVDLATDGRSVARSNATSTRLPVTLCTWT